MGPTPTTSGEPGFRNRIRSHWWASVLLALLGVMLASGPLPGNAYVEGPAAGHTGGFAEATCHECHFDQPINDPEGTLTLKGVPDTYTPGQSYGITITLKRPAIGRGGFQLAARFATGELKGNQAGSLQAVDARVQVAAAEDRDVHYAQHTSFGSNLTSTEIASWTIAWISPTTGGSVAFHVAANAANDDASEFGDFIYTQNGLARPPR